MVRRIIAVPVILALLAVTLCAGLLFALSFLPPLFILSPVLLPWLALVMFGALLAVALLAEWSRLAYRWLVLFLILDALVGVAYYAR